MNFPKAHISVLRKKPKLVVISCVGLMLIAISAFYWFNKLEVLLVNKDVKPEWMPAEVWNGKTVWGKGLSPKKDILVVPYGRSTFRLFFNPQITSVDGLWYGAKPSISFKGAKSINYRLKTATGEKSPEIPNSTIKQYNIHPYIDVNINLDKANLHKIISAETRLKVSYPSRSKIGMFFGYIDTSIKRDFKLYIVSAKEYKKVKMIIKGSYAEGIAIPFIQVFIIVIGCAVMVRCFRSVNKEVRSMTGK